MPSPSSKALSKSRDSSRARPPLPLWERIEVRGITPIKGGRDISDENGSIISVVKVLEGKENDFTTSSRKSFQFQP